MWPWKSPLRSCLSPCITISKCSSSIPLSTRMALCASFRIVCGSGVFLVPYLWVGQWRLYRKVWSQAWNLTLQQHLCYQEDPLLPGGPSVRWALVRDCEVVASVVASKRDWGVLSHFCCKSSLNFSIAGCRSAFPVGCSIESMTTRYTALGIYFRSLLIRNLSWSLSWSLREYACSFASGSASTNKAGNGAFFPISAG